MGALSYPVMYHTDETVDEVESWLASQCEGGWSVALESRDEDDDPRKSLKVVFERESDIRTLCQPRA